MFPYPKIEQFRGVISEVGRSDALRNSTITFEGTVKLHGTNAAVVLEIDGGNYYVQHCQSRNRIITPEDDNNGFAAWATEQKWKDILTPTRKQVAVFGEWCGGSIQSGVALSQLPKMFVIFEIKQLDGSVNIPLSEINREALPENVYVIDQFPSRKIDIDFKNPGAITEQLVSITDAVEKECPVGKYFGVSGVGEGVVWKAFIPGLSSLRFKVKGDEHSASKVKKLNIHDVQDYQVVDEFISDVLTERRLNQGVEYLQEMGIELSQKGTGDFLRWVINDIHKEEADTISKAEFDIKLINQRASKVAKDWFFQRIQDY